MPQMMHIATNSSQPRRVTASFSPRAAYPESVWTPVPYESRLDLTPHASSFSMRIRPIALRDRRVFALPTMLHLSVVVAPDQPVNGNDLGDRPHAGDERHQDEGRREHHHDHPDLGVRVPRVLERPDLVPERV